uniref:Putative secreted protein n=1 Tax=Anopheles marajoara TaxID=58244 RepID=A0A2M4CFJ0_9DIPT
MSDVAVLLVLHRCLPGSRCTCRGRHENRANRQLAAETMAAACSPPASNRTLRCSCGREEMEMEWRK